MSKQQRVKVFVHQDETLRLLSFTRDMLRAVQIGEGELSEDERMSLQQMYETLAYVYKQVKDGRN